jgi:hypothetical protein
MCELSITWLGLLCAILHPPNLYLYLGIIPKFTINMSLVADNIYVFVNLKIHRYKLVGTHISEVQYMSKRAFTVVCVCACLCSFTIMLCTILFYYC